MSDNLPPTAKHSKSTALKAARTGQWRVLSRAGVLGTLCLFAHSQVLGLPPSGQLRIPAEWEPHAATWMQWPDRYEKKLRPAFARIIQVVQQYEPVVLLTRNAGEQEQVMGYLRAHGVPTSQLQIRRQPFDNAWLRDNGPVYAVQNGRRMVLDWRFDGWGGHFGPQVGFQKDDTIPTFIARSSGMARVDRSDYILERGNLETNGQGLFLLNWDCQKDRNANLNQAQQTAYLKKALGARQILWVHGHDPTDRTTGHIDGQVRFSDPDTIIISRDLLHLPGPGQKSSAAHLKQQAHRLGLRVHFYDGDLNWLVGNGFVLAASSGIGARDHKLKQALQSFFPGRQVHLIDVRSIQASGGGIHCVTNDQPAKH